MYWGGRKLQNGFVSILDKKLMRNVYSQVRPSQGGDTTPSPRPSARVSPTRPQPPDPPKQKKLCISLGVVAFVVFLWFRILLLRFHSEFDEPLEIDENENETNET